MEREGGERVGGIREYANPELVIDLRKKRKRKKREVIAPDSK
ncbi:MAG: hypothetical protein KatS3mg028_1486 [Bacteroidia bacterium]|nr:MAG: hypothetical protein KatS3mg028_1486 [Bacteroidia bacterium]